AVPMRGCGAISSTSRPASFTRSRRKRTARRSGWRSVSSPTTAGTSTYLASGAPYCCRGGPAGTCASSWRAAASGSPTRTARSSAGTSNHCSAASATDCWTGGEDLRVVGERLELERIARGVEQEHRPLLAGFALETDVGLDDEFGAGRAQTFGER